MKPMFSLSDSQLDVLMKFSALVPVNLRGSFLRSVANQVADINRVTDRDIEVAAKFVLANYGVSTGPRTPLTSRTDKARQKAEQSFVGAR